VVQQLAAISGCPLSRIFVVPGNHDVDRQMIRNSVPIQNVQHAIASATIAKRAGKLRQQLTDENSGQTLMKPHSAYNEFAAPLGCQIWPAKPFWHQDVDLARIIHEKCAIKAKPLISFTTMRIGCLMKFFAMKSLAQVFGGLGRFRAVR